MDWAVRAARTLRADLWTGATERLPRGRRPGGDWWPVFVVPVVLIAVVLFGGSANSYWFREGMGLWGVLLAGAQSGALVLALTRPVLAWWISTAAIVVTALAGGPLLPATGVGLGVQAGVLFLVALLCRSRVAAETLAIGVLTTLIGTWFTHLSHDDRPTIAILATAVMLGAALHGRQAARTELVVQEELTAEERARRTLLEERSRIARELHDVVAHHMSVISIQAQVAPLLVANPSDELRENLAGIRQNALEALTELRRVLGVLRSEDSLSDGMRHTPQPSLDRLDELFANVRAAGLTVTAETTGRRRQLSPGVELSAFRIVQEALSNAMRHAPGAAVRVELGHHPDGLTIRVANTAPDRPVPPSPGAGHGLLGMRERCAMLGGELATGPTPDGGYEVTALLPANSPAEDAE